MKYRIKEIEINGGVVYAIVKTWLFGLIECPLIRRLAFGTTLAQAEKMRMELEIKQNKK